MGRGVRDRWIVPAALAVGLAGAAVPGVLARELTPYGLPSQQRAMPDMHQQAAPRPTQPAVDEAP